MLHQSQSAFTSPASASMMRVWSIGSEAEGSADREWDEQEMMLKRSRVHSGHILLGRWPCDVCPPSISV